jgi:NDP-sugar pyrophosphorylase family protein
VGNRVAKQVPVTYVYQELSMVPEGCSVPADRKKPWGTTHALWCGREVLKGKSFLTINSDDYYGREALQNAYDFFMKEESEQRHAVIGYDVINTLTENGTVSRGVCVVDENNNLVRIDERKEIKLEAKRGYYTTDHGVTYHLIPANAVASMNMWAFQPGFIEDISESFEARFRKGLQENPLGFEETISDAVQSILDRGKGSVEVVPTVAKWFGMTYQEDYDAVREQLAELTAEGYYPQSW